MSVPSSVSRAWAEAGEPPALEVRGLFVAYDDRTVLEGVDFRAEAGSLVGIVGPNGAGKSTFLKAVLDLVPRLSGAIRVFGRPLDKRAGLVAYVPQRASLEWDFPITAVEVVAMGLYRRIGWFRPVRKHHLRTALARLERVGLADLADRPVGELSGGQRQRLLLARALAQDARLYLLDEPLAGIDAASERLVLDLFAELRAGGATVVVVHHDLDTVADRFEEVLLLNRRAIAFGPPSRVLTAANLARAYGTPVPVRSWNDRESLAPASSA
ncbi:MAG: metal ABC transporter ATP-binding protein [Geminicoccaceae bacterium]|nr:metal ABC transporter ATP-binding protein [Geminicoccaceae bacterium]